MKQIKEIVEKCLQNDIQARNDDYRLFLDVCKELNLPCNISVEKMFTEHSELHFPSFESIGRVRRKYQQMGLYCANETVQSWRAEKEREFHLEYANIHP